MRPGVNGVERVGQSAVIQYHIKLVHSKFGNIAYTGIIPFSDHGSFLARLDCFTLEWRVGSVKG